MKARLLRTVAAALVVACGGGDEAPPDAPRADASAASDAAPPPDGALLFDALPPDALPAPDDAAPPPDDAAAPPAPDAAGTTADAGSIECSPPCAAGSFCQAPIGACAGPGSCVPIPMICPDVYLPVCGCDGMTYGNACELAAASMSERSDGECP